MNSKLRKVDLISKPKVGDVIKCYAGIDEYFVGVCVGIMYDEMISSCGEKYMKQKARVRKTTNDPKKYDYYYTCNSYKFEV
jgi:uncharacterized protein involved in propanediol utilization